MKLKPISYEGFLDSMKSVSAPQLKHQAKNIIEHFKPSKQITSPFSPTTYILDYCTKKYVYMDESCFDMLGYTASYLLETGVDEYLSKWHSDDFQVINKRVFPDCINFLKTLRPEDYNDYIFSYNYRVKNARQDYVTLLQRFSYISGPSTYEPVGVIGVAFDITHYKNDTSIVHTIERSVSYEKGVVNDLVFKKVHSVLSGEEKQLSKKEITILRHIAEGMASKQIADKMSLSINTINNHRRNMLTKTKCRSSSELINHAIKHGLI